MQTSTRSALLVGGLLLAASSTLPAQISPDTVVIEGGTLIDGNGGPPVRDAVIVIQGNKFADVGRKGQVSYPAAARVLQADGKFIVPGLMDAHVHYGEWLPELFLAHGVTSVFEIGGGGEWVLAQREAVLRARFRGPGSSSPLEASRARGLPRSAASRPRKACCAAASSSTRQSGQETSSGATSARAPT